MAETYQSALIVGAGAGLSASLARAFARAGMKIALAARSVDKLSELAQETGAERYACDASQRDQVEKLFAALDGAGAPDVVVYNASYRTRGPFLALDPVEVEKAIIVSAFGGFLVAQAAVKRMLPRGRGAMLFTGASASVKGYAQSAPFAMGKFALRPVPADQPDSLLDPDAIAQTYLHVLQQPRSAWTHEIELRPWVEKF
jgi:NADP-dependent 3-hydroxy acid dehydrogenase YdfG